MEQRKFKVVNETEYGPQLVRIGSSADPDVHAPRNLDLVGDIESRRKFMLGTGALGGALAVLGVRKVLDTSSEAGVNLREHTGKISKGYQSEPGTGGYQEESSVEAPERTKMFEKELSGYRAWFGLRKDQVLFVDEENVPVGGPVSFQEVKAPKFHKDGRLQTERYPYTPGPTNEIGIPESGIAGEWLDLIRDGLAYNYPDRRVARQLHTVIDFNKALHEDDEPELVAAIKRGEIEDYRGLVEYFSSKPVIGAEGMSRLEYVQEMIQFEDTVPPVVQEELRKILPGLCAQESKFNNGVTSPAGAKGIFQFMPDIWAHYGGTAEDLNSLQRQVEIAGRFFSDLYREVQINIGQEEIHFLEKKFNDRDTLERQLIVPLMVNSYNAGSSRVAEAVKEYIRNTDVEQMPEGEDLFLAIADYAMKNKQGRLGRYGKDAREYVPRIYAQAEMLRSVALEF